MSTTVAPQTKISYTKASAPEHYRLTKVIMGNALLGLGLKWLMYALILTAVIFGMLGVNSHQVSIPGVIFAALAVFIGIMSRRARLRGKAAIAAFKALPLPKQ